MKSLNKTNEKKKFLHREWLTKIAVYHNILMQVNPMVNVIFYLSIFYSLFFEVPLDIICPIKYF